jgi:hypothetical protein
MAFEPIVIGLGAIVVAALLYWAQQDRRARERRASAREARIRPFVDGYCRRFPGEAGLHNLVTAGVLSLKGDQEIREACERIRLASNKHPIPATYLDLMSSVDLHVFFREFARRLSEMSADSAVRALIDSLKGTRRDA